MSQAQYKGSMRRVVGSQRKVYGFGVWGAGFWEGLERFLTLRVNLRKHPDAQTHNAGNSLYECKQWLWQPVPWMRALPVPLVVRVMLLTYGVLQIPRECFEPGSAAASPKSPTSRQVQFKRCSLLSPQNLSQGYSPVSNSMSHLAR